MSEQQTPTAAENSAWAEFHTPYSVEQLRAFCTADVERLFRINPYLEFNKWEKIGDNRFHVSGKNISQATPFEFDLELTVGETAEGLRVAYQDGLKKSTLFRIEPDVKGSKMTIIDEYIALSEEQAAARAGEVDHSLTTWAEYLLRYIVTWKQWSWLAPWRWYMRRVWQPMKPMSRRITYMLIWITVFEIALIALGVAIYFAEYG